MRIVVNTIGSTGDLFPFIALGQGLKTRGHEVVFAVNPRMHPTLKKAGLECRACGPPLGEEDAAAHLKLFEGHDPLRQLRLLMLEWLIPSTENCYHELMSACKGADALIATSIQFAAPMVHEILGLPWITVSLSPSQFRTRFEPPLGFTDTGLTLVNRLCWALANAVLRWNFLAPLNEMRARLGFGPVDCVPTLTGFSPKLTLLASSPQFSPKQPDWDPSVKQTGFWFYDGKDQADWQPAPELRAFVERGGKPIVLSLGSMVQKDPVRVVQVHAEAAAQLKQRLIVQQGWAKLSVEGLKSSMPAGDLIGAGFLPHEWLFSHARAVIHHGGAGTTARALRNGCPMLLEPHGFDQPYNARRIRNLGLGDAVPSHKITVNRLIKALERVLSDEVQQNAISIAEKVRAEDGVGDACDLIEACVRNGLAQQVNAVGAAR